MTNKDPCRYLFSYFKDIATLHGKSFKKLHCTTSPVRLSVVFFAMSPVPLPGRHCYRSRETSKLLAVPKIPLPRLALMPCRQLTATNCHVWTQERGNGKTEWRQLKVSGRGKRKVTGETRGDGRKGAERHLHHSKSIQSHWVINLQSVRTKKVLPVSSGGYCQYITRVCAILLPIHFKPLCFISPLKVCSEAGGKSLPSSYLLQSL